MLCGCTIDLVTVFEPILTSRQTREKLQCLYENLMSNNLRKTAVLKKMSIVKVNFLKVIPDEINPKKSPPEYVL